MIVRNITHTGNLLGKPCVNVFTDTHCHLNLNLFQSDLNEVLERAFQLGVERILIPGIDLETSERAVQLSLEDRHLYAAVGIHPNDALTWDEDTLTRLKELASSPRVVAIGEIGLDYYRKNTPVSLQKEIFSAQLSLAEETQKPVIIHGRESLADLWQILSTWQQSLMDHNSVLANRPGVLHSYEGDLDTALQAIRCGFRIGISGPVTFRNARDRQSIAAALPIDSILTETDAPYLTPHPFRGRRNEPSHVVWVAEKIAALQNRSVSEVAAVTTQNADRFFDWRSHD
jgi:TatD DNase family protein